MDEHRDDAPHDDERMSMHVDNLPLTVRAHNCLRRAEITLVADLVRKTPAELLAIRNMGVTSLRDVQQTLAAMGLRLAMSPDAVSDALTGDNELAADTPDAGDCDAFLQVMSLLAGAGVKSAAEVVRLTPDEILALPGMNPHALAHLEAGLALWGLHLSRPAPAPTSDDPEEDGAATEDVLPPADNPETFRDELTYAIPRLLDDVKGVSPTVFVAYHGVDGAPAQTLQEIGDAGREHGFDRPVTRERIRQVLKKTESKLTARAHRMRFTLWEPTVDEARRHLPSSVESFATRFGYGSARYPESVFTMLGCCARFLELQFPFDVQKVSALGSLVVDPERGDDAVPFVSHLQAAVRYPYVDLAELAARIGAASDVVAAIVEASPRLEFLDDERRYFWRPPELPPPNFSITGNPILTALCKVFSVATRATSADLAQSVPRDRIVRKHREGPPVDLPLPVLEGIARRSGLFDVDDGLIARRADTEWCTIGERDIALLNVCAEHGRVVASDVLYTSLVRAGLSSQNGAARVVYSPFLVHVQAGDWAKEGIYKFVVQPEDAARLLRERSRSNAEKTKTPAASSQSRADETCLRVPNTSRARTFGRFVASAPIGRDGTWSVQGPNGAHLGRVDVAGKTVSGLAPVIEALELTSNEVLEIRFSEATGTATVRRGR